MLSVIAPEYLMDKLDDAKSGEILERAFIKEFKLLQKILQDKTVGRAFDKLEIDPDGILPTEQLDAGGMDLISKFLASLK